MFIIKELIIIKQGISRNRLDRFLATHLTINKKSVRLILAKGLVRVDNFVIKDIDFIINKFSKITFDGEVLQNNKAIYIMMNKPVGVISATKDPIHKTVIELLEQPLTDDLHLVGRLDKNTSGLLLLTNDSRWSESITLPNKKIVKTYDVTLENTISEDYVEVFQQGMYFSFEDIITQPAKLEIISDYKARVFLTEGKYHQIKRMFGRFRNPVTKLHRSAIGALELDKNLANGESRALTEEEVNLFV